MQSFHSAFPWSQAVLKGLEVQNGATGPSLVPVASSSSAASGPLCAARRKGSSRSWPPRWCRVVSLCLHTLVDSPGTRAALSQPKGITCAWHSGFLMALSRQWHKGLAKVWLSPPSSQRFCITFAWLGCCCSWGAPSSPKAGGVPGGSLGQAQPRGGGRECLVFLPGSESVRCTKPL